MKWIKTGKTFSSEGSTVAYTLDEAPEMTIESRKRQIPHASRSGTWEYTSYFVLRDGEELIEKHSLRDAKEYAEAYVIERGLVSHG
jgi:hypothetical protein